MIEVKNLVKSYGPHKAVRDISFTVEPGKIYGFLGPNGAGKSTTMNIIAGTLASTSGSVTINGHDIYGEPTAAKRCIGYLPEIPPLYTDMTPVEYLTFVGEAKGLSGAELYGQIEEVLELTGTTAVMRRLIRNLSKGYKQRVGIAQAMLGNPEIIILDEPTVGLDPIQIIEIRELIKSLGEKHTVIISSHILSEISEVCDHVIIISNGRLVANDLLSDLEEKYTSDCELELQLKCDKNEAEELYGHLLPLSESGELLPRDEHGVCRVLLRYPRANDIRAMVFSQVQKSGVCMLAMIPHVKTLEDIFLQLTAESPEQENAPDAEGGKPEDGADNPGNGGGADNAGAGKDENNTDGGGDYKPLFG